jgi:hypothetical protein
MPLKSICMSSSKRRQKYANGWKANRGIVCCESGYLPGGSIWYKAKRIHAVFATRVAFHSLLSGTIVSLTSASSRHANGRVRLIRAPSGSVVDDAMSW